MVSFSEKYGMEYVDVEMGKKEDRNKEAKRVRLNTFLKIYNDTDIYLVEDAMDSMKGRDFSTLQNITDTFPMAENCIELQSAKNIF